jgi:hypothetical protein
MRRDRRMMRDGRNPYGSRGGYVVSSRRGDRASSGRGRSMGRGRDGYTGDLADPLYNERKRIVEESMGQYPIHSDYEYATDYDKASHGRNVMYEGRYGNTPFEYNRREDYNYGRDYMYDYDMMDYNYERDYGDTLNEEEIHRWCMKLKNKLDPKDKEMFSKEKVMKKAEAMGIPFEEFTEEELYLTTLMMYTDYNKTLGSANLDIYMKLAKDWLMDDDVEVRGSEKLAKYYDEIVMGD